MKWHLSRRGSLYALAAAILIALIAPAGFLGSGRYSAYASGLQAAGVLVALVLAMITLDADRHDKRVDRVLALHQELVSGEIEGCRVRLIDHLRKRGGGHRIVAVTRDDLQRDPRISSYDGTTEYTPFHDANTILRFFERANAAVKAGTVNEPLFHELIIRQALWWDAALRPSSMPWVGKSALDELRSWAETYEKAHATELNYLTSWRNNRMHDFGHELDAREDVRGSAGPL
jgi:hypothetical protein